MRQFSRRSLIVATFCCLLAMMLFSLTVESPKAFASTGKKPASLLVAMAEKDPSAFASILKKHPSLLGVMAEKDPSAFVSILKKHPSLLRDIAEDDPSAFVSILKKKPGSPLGAITLTVNFTNSTGLSLTRASDTLAHGYWVTEPPNTMNSGPQPSWVASGQGDGVHGVVKYNTNVGTVEVDFDLPILADNYYSVSTPPGYTCSFSGGTGYNATINITLQTGSGGGCKG